MGMPSGPMIGQSYSYRVAQAAYPIPMAPHTYTLIPTAVQPTLAYQQSLPQPPVMNADGVMPGYYIKDDVMAYAPVGGGRYQRQMQQFQVFELHGKESNFFFGGGSNVSVVVHL